MSNRSKSLKRYWRKFTPAQRSAIHAGPPVERRRRSSLELVVAKVLATLEVAYEEQVRVAGYLCDFVLLDLRVVIEVDGAYWHKMWDRPSTEPIRDRKIAEAGYRVVRISESDVRTDPVAAVIRGIDPE